MIIQLYNKTYSLCFTHFLQPTGGIKKIKYKSIIEGLLFRLDQNSWTLLTKIKS